MTDEDYLRAVLNCDDQSGMATDAAWRAVSALRARAERAEAAIQRVRELCEDKSREVAMSDPLFGPPSTLAVTDILRALDGGAPND